ncbi:hypothetical protein JCM3765_004746 [Sporobolomyces pararoseus]
MDTLIPTILSGLSNLPSGTNPYLWIADLIKRTSNPKFSRSGRNQLYLIAGLLSLDAILVLVSLILRFRKNQLWLFRKRKSLILPNQINLVILLGLFILGLVILLVLSFVRAIEGAYLTYLGYLIFLFPIFAEIAGEIIVWSFAASFIVHLESTKTTAQPLDKWILASNILGISVPLLHIASFIPLDVLGGNCYASIVRTMKEIQQTLLIESTKWTPGELFNLGNLLPLQPLFIQLEGHYKKFKAWWIAVYVFHTVVTSLLMLSLLAVTIPYLYSVRKLILRGKQGLIEAGRGAILLEQAQRAWNILVVAMSLFFLIAFVTFAFSLLALIKPLDQAESVILASFWINALLASLLAGLLLLHTIQSPRPDPPPTRMTEDRTNQWKKDREIGFRRASVRIWKSEREEMFEAELSVVENATPVSHVASTVDSLTKREDEKGKFEAV